MKPHKLLLPTERFPLLQDLSDLQRRLVEHATSVHELKRGARVYRAGDPGDAIYFVKSGVIRIASDGREGPESILSFRYPGDVFGELALVEDGPRDHGAQAYEDAVVGLVGRDVLLSLVNDSPAFARQVTRLLCVRLERLRRRVGALLSRNAQSRVARVLTDLAAQHGVSDHDGIVIPLRLSQTELANLAGLRRETINVVLRDLKQRRLIEIDRRTVRIKHLDQLEALR